MQQQLQLCNACHTHITASSRNVLQFKYTLIENGYNIHTRDNSAIHFCYTCMSDIRNMCGAVNRRICAVVRPTCADLSCTVKMILGSKIYIYRIV